MGVGLDHIRARAQDGSGTNNAAFFTPPEPPPPGSNPPYMRMFLWDTNLPASILDGDFDNAIIAHEYGHGVSNRLVGGAATNSCLINFEQGGEGWSDFFGLMLTMADHNSNGTIEKTILGEGIRSIGAYVLGNGANESGVRPAYYSYNMDCTTANCNDYTYGDVPNMPEPHGVGFIWCTMLWDMTLDLIDQHGFEADIYNIPSNVANHKGNTRALNLVLEGLKLTPCNPTFPQMREAILDADTAIYGAGNSNLIWAAFARRGLGYSATSGGNEAFDDPTMQVTKTVNKTQIEVGDELTYSITVKNNSKTALTEVNISDPVPANLNVTSISNGGSVQSGEVIYPQILEIPIGQSVERTFSAEVVAPNWTTTEYDNPIESLTQPDFTSLGAWLVDGGNPNTGSTLSWWHLDPPTAVDASLFLTLNLDGAKNNYLSFWHYYDLESNVDGAVIELALNGDTVDLDARIKKNGYNRIILDELNTPIGVPIPLNTLSGRRAFSGYSGGYINTIIDLSGYNGLVSIRFRLASNLTNVTANCDGTIPGCDGWYLDDFKLYDLKNIQNTAYASSAQGYMVSGNVGNIGTMFFEAGALPVELLYLNAQPSGQNILINWATANEINNRGFELQKRSGTKGDFQKIAWIEGQGNSTLKTNYQWIDVQVEPGTTHYYRLRQTDLNGDVAYSEVVSARVLTDEQAIRVYPNPVNDQLFYLQFGKTVEEPFIVNILTLQGQMAQQYELPGDASLYQIKLSDLASGVYFVNVRLSENIYQKKLVIP